MLNIEQVVDHLLAERPVVGVGIVGVDARRTVFVVDAVGVGASTALEDVVAGQRDVHGDAVRRAAPLAVQQVGDAPAPAVGDACVRDGGLPLLDLIGVRIQAEGQPRAAAFDARRVHRLEERPDVGDQGKFAVAVEGLQLRDGRMQGVVAPGVRAIRDAGDRQQRALIQCQIRTQVRVFGELVGVVRNQHVERVVAAGEEDAHQSPLVAGVGCSRSARESQAQPETRQGRCRGAELAAMGEERAPGSHQLSTT